MTGPHFFTRLRKEGRLAIVEPSDDIKTAYLNKSESYLASARILFDNGKLEESIPTAYYSMFYALLALLFRAGIKCENHSAAIILLKEIFGIDNSEIAAAKKERIDLQYYVDSALVREEADEFIKAAEQFNARLRNVVERLHSGQISVFREKMKRLLGRRRK